ncbi:unnamed protein product [Fasciola hepatica]|uniref:Uncharacterized protein n=1 Tax=Fasciola hepatica TaxID=6192 RepID=A0ABC9HGA7_FASHE
MTIIYFLFFSVIYLVWTSVEGETVRISMKDSKMLSELIDEFKSAVQQFTAVVGTNLREETKSLYESAWSIFRKSALELRRASTMYGVTRSGKAVRLTDRMKLTEDLAKIINAALSAANVMVQWCKVAKKNVLHSNPLWVMFDEVGRRFQIIKISQRRIDSFYKQLPWTVRAQLQGVDGGLREIVPALQLGEELQIDNM